MAQKMITVVTPINLCLTNILRFGRRLSSGGARFNLGWHINYQILISETFHGLSGRQYFDTGNEKIR
jgi:hypothetical protein